MIDRSAAREIAGRDVPRGVDIDDGQVRELPQGWFFPYRCTGEPTAGSQGVIVNKTTGAVFQLGSAFPVDRDIFNRYDLVITSIGNMERALDALGQLRISVVEPAYEHGTVWKIPRTLTRAELRTRLNKLPHVFGHLALYFQAEALERSRQTGVLGFELLDCGCLCGRSSTGRCS